MLKFRSQISLLMWVLALVTACAPKSHTPCGKDAEPDFESGVVFPGTEAPFIHLTIVDKDLSGGAIKGFFKGAGYGVLGCVRTAYYLCLYPPLLAVFAGTGAVVGTVAGAYTADSVVNTSVAPEGIEQLISNSGLRYKIVTAVFDKVVATENKKLNLAVDPRPDDLSSAKYGDSDVIIAIEPSECSLVGYNDIWGPFELSLTFRTTLWSTQDSDECSPSHYFECVSDKQTLIKWRENNYQLLEQTLEKCVNDISQQITAHYF
ncbi:MAG: hypothetical protein GQ530_04210 [Desulfuromonadales bacterium]|nr:hypothetical protein [Desulfuromonadales bacterium]